MTDREVLWRARRSELASQSGSSRSAMRIVYVVGTRPNFVKTAPVIAALRARAARGAPRDRPHRPALRPEMSEVFLEELGVPAPDHMLDVGSGTHAEQTARVMERLEPVLAEERPDLVLVPGDVNSTLAAALVAAKTRLPVAHVEAGLRSFDRTMPEEINRIVTDELSRLPLPPQRRGDREPPRRGDRRRAHPLRRQRDDRHPGRARGPLPRRRRRGQARGRAGRLRARHAAPAGERRRPAAAPSDGARWPRVAPSCRSSSRSTRGRRKMLEAVDAGIAGLHADRAARLPRLPLAGSPTPAPCSPTRAGSRRRRPPSACPASPCATTPSAR